MDLAIKNRQKVRKEYKDEEEERAMERRRHMAQSHIRREALKLKAHKERNALSQLHLITTSEELQQAISDIDNKSLSLAKKTAEKPSLLSTQIKIRKNKDQEKSLRAKYSYYIYSFEKAKTLKFGKNCHSTLTNIPLNVLNLFGIQVL